MKNGQGYVCHALLEKRKRNTTAPLRKRRIAHEINKISNQTREGGNAERPTKFEGIVDVNSDPEKWENSKRRNRRNPSVKLLLHIYRRTPSSAA